jgi:NADH-ubiquinone oxidoreductase chain 5
LVGICSYLLVNFWYTRIAANQSSISALLTNRVGDCFLTIGMFAIFAVFGNWEEMLMYSLPIINCENKKEISLSNKLELEKTSSLVDP